MREITKAIDLTGVIGYLDTETKEIYHLSCYGPGEPLSTDTPIYEGEHTDAMCADCGLPLYGSRNSES